MTRVIHPNSLANLRFTKRRSCGHQLEQVGDQRRCRTCRNAYLRAWRRLKKAKSRVSSCVEVVGWQL